MRFALSGAYPGRLKDVPILSKLGRTINSAIVRARSEEFLATGLDFNHATVVALDNSSDLSPDLRLRIEHVSLYFNETSRQPLVLMRLAAVAPERLCEIGTLACGKPGEADAPVERSSQAPQTAAPSGSRRTSLSTRRTAATPEQRKRTEAFCKELRTAA